MAAALVLAAGSVCAQTEPVAQTTEVVEESTDNVEINSFWSNWFISAGGGAQIYFGDHDRQASFGDRLSGALDIAVGKWFSPEIGVRLMYSGLSAKGATQKGHLAHSTGVDVPGKGGNGYWLEKSKFNFFNFQIDAMFNASNIIWGYNEKRVYNLSPYVGLGVMRVSDKPAETAIAGHFGLLNSFRLTSCLDLNLDIRGTLVNDDFDGEPGGRKGEGLLTATLGLTYKFSPRGWNRGKNVIRTVYNTAEIKAMQEKLNSPQWIDTMDITVYDITKLDTLDSARAWLERFFDELKKVNVPANSALVRSVLEYVREHVMEGLMLENVAAKFYVSPNHLSTLIRKETGVTYRQHVINAKMAVAKQMLDDTRMRVEDIAYAIGYENYISFYNVFRKTENMSPTEYRFSKNRE